jgi:prephenate dehydrogenase
MGGWLTQHLRGIGYKVESIDACPEKLEALDLVFVSVPIGATPTVIREITPRMRRGAVLAEIASLKTESHAALLEASRLGVSPLCIHPMFGPSTTSLHGRVVAVIPVADPANELVRTGLLFPGAGLVKIDAGRHDRCMAAVLSLPYAMNLALTRVLGGKDLALVSRIAGPTFTLQYTLAQSVAGESPTLIRDLLGGNISLEPLLRAFSDSIEEVMEASKDERGFTALHSKIVETLSRDPSYREADAHRQRAYRAMACA